MGVSEIIYSDFMLHFIVLCVSSHVLFVVRSLSLLFFFFWFRHI